MNSKVSGMAPHSLYNPQVIIALHLPSGNMCINSLFPKYFIHELAMGILSQRCSQKLKRSANFLQFLQYRFFCIVYLVDDAAWSSFSLHRIKRSTLLCLDTLTQLAQRRPKVAGFNLSQEQTQSTNPNAKACTVYIWLWNQYRMSTFICNNTTSCDILPVTWARKKKFLRCTYKTFVTRLCG